MTAAKRTSERAVLGFGFEPAQSPSHFAVHLDADGEGPVTIEERFAWENTGDTRPPVLKVVLDRYRWSRIADQVRANFNKRLRDRGLPTARWKASGDTVLAPYLGKELTLLAWAVEDADPTLIPNMLANWLGLAPEERWWLYTTINATAGHPLHGRERGWRKAIKIAFAENPADAPPSTLIESCHEDIRLPLPAEFQATLRQVAAVPGGAPEPPTPPGAPDTATKSMPAHVASTVAAQLERRAKRPRVRGQMPLLPGDEQ